MVGGVSSSRVISCHVWFLVLCSTDKTRWMESIQRPHNEGEEEKIYQHWGKLWEGPATPILGGSI